MNKKNQRSSGKLPDQIIKAVYDHKSELIGDWMTIDNIDQVDSDNRTILFHATIVGLTDIVSLILKVKPGINLQDKKGWSILHYAAQSCHLQLAKLLIENGADMEIRDNYGNTPLWRAVFACQGKGDVIKLLISKGANPNNENEAGISPLALAKKIANYDIEQFF